MSRISQDELDEMLKKDEPICFPKYITPEEREGFSIVSCVRGKGITHMGEELEGGMSYASGMLDINELMEKHIVGLGDKIDLRNFPDVKTIQVAWQSQLDMLDEDSKAQIESIHLSNDFLVGRFGYFECENYFPMDTTLDLSDYKNVTQVQAHAYVNDDLEKIILPKGVKKFFSKYSYMNIDERDMQNIEVVTYKASRLGDGSNFHAIEDYAENYFQSRNIEYLQAFKEQGGNMSDILNEAIHIGKLDFVKSAVENGADIKISSRPLDYAVGQIISHNELCKLRDYGFTILGARFSKETPEQLAERREIVKYLISQGANLGRTRTGAAPLITAIGTDDMRDYETSEILAKAGAPITTSEAKRAMYDAKMFELLVENGYKPTKSDLREAIEMGNQSNSEEKLHNTVKVIDLIITANPKALKKLNDSEDELSVDKLEISNLLRQKTAKMESVAENPMQHKIREMKQKLDENVKYTENNNHQPSESARTTNGQRQPSMGDIVNTVNNSKKKFY